MTKPICNKCNTEQRELKQFSKNVFGCPVCYRLYDAAGKVDGFSITAPFTVRKRIFGMLNNRNRLNKMFG